MVMKFSLILPAALQEAPFAEVAAWASSAGFHAVDAEVWFDAAAASVLQAHGLLLGPMRIRASLADSDLATRRQAIESALQTIDAAVALGLDLLWTLPRNFRNDASPQQNYDAVCASLPEVVLHAERKGVRIAIENCPYNGQNVICTPETWDALFAAIRSDALGICLDPSHCIWQRIDYVRVIREYAPRIYHVQAKDTEILSEGLYRYGVEGRVVETGSKRGDSSGWWRHRLPGLGEVDWASFVAALARSGYDGLLSLEHEDPEWSGSRERVESGFAQGRAHVAQFVTAA